MKIAINASPLTSGHKDRGTGSYTKSLIDALRKYEPDHVYHLFNNAREISGNIDLVHYPFFDPFFVTLPLFSLRPYVVTVHDLIPLVFPEHFPKGIRGTIKWEIQKRTLSRARRIITDSETSRGDIVRVLGFSEERVDPIFLAPDESYQLPVDISNQATIIKKYDLPQKYFLYVGDVNWNKNVAHLLLGWKEFTTSRPDADEYRLILVGKAFIGARTPEARELDALIASLPNPDSVIRLGFVPVEDLAHIYALSLSTLIPSWYEGFGLPVLEAMATGTLVITSNGGSLKEISGPAIKIDTPNPNEIAHALLQVVEMNSEARKKKIKEGYNWVKKFSWKKVASETITSYEKAITYK